MKARVVAFVPLKRQSLRLPQKNLKMLGNQALYLYILKCLQKISRIDQIFVYSSDLVFKEKLPKKIQFLKRPKRLDGCDVRGMEIYRHFCRQVPADLYLLAHATSPFLFPVTIERALNAVLSGAWDSAFSCVSQRTYAWYQKRPLNYSLTDIPRTQDLEPVVSETNGFYIFNGPMILSQSRRIGLRPFACEVSSLEALDIHYADDFALAKNLLKHYRKLSKKPQPRAS